MASAESMRSALVSRSALRCKDSRLDFYVRFVTLRRVLATSWKAIGRIRPIWSRLDAPKERRELLARLTRIPAPDLSAMNTGKRPMTMAKAERIMAAVPGVTLLDLGAPVAGEVQPARLALALAQLREAMEAVTFPRAMRVAARAS